MIGPFTPGFVADQSLANELAEIGVILLMFGVGLHFSLKDLLSVRAHRGARRDGPDRRSPPRSARRSRWLLGWSLGAGLVFGLALSVASTVVLLRALQERRLLDTERGRIAVGWLVVEDLAMVLALVLLPALGRPEPEALRGAEPARPLALPLAHHARQGRGIRRADAGGRPARHPLAPALRRAYRLARAVPACRAGDRARRRLRRGELFDVSFALGAFFAGMILSESDAQPARRAGNAAAARRLRGAVLRLGRHAVQSRRDPEPAACRCSRRC